ncbi:Fibrillin protein 5-like protein [Drosera capensis]
MAATSISHHPIPHLHVSRLPKLMPPIPIPLYPWTRRQCPTGSSPQRQSHSIIRVEKQSIGGFEDDGNQSIAQVKMKLYQAVEGINRGVFGVTAAKKAEIEGLVEVLQPLNPTMNPTLHLDKVAGSWKVLYSSIKILGSKRTKLGLRDFITLGDFWQHIDTDMGKAVNVIEFSARGLNMLKGQLTIDARFSVASTSLLKVFKQNYELLISIFNPDGWLEITYLDDTLRIGRDDKDNIFILERSTSILV